MLPPMPLLVILALIGLKPSVKMGDVVIRTGTSLAGGFGAGPPLPDRAPTFGGGSGGDLDRVGVKPALMPDTAGATPPVRADDAGSAATPSLFFLPKPNRLRLFCFFFSSAPAVAEEPAAEGADVVCSSLRVEEEEEVATGSNGGASTGPRPLPPLESGAESARLIVGDIGNGVTAISSRLGREEWIGSLVAGDVLIGECLGLVVGFFERV